MYIQQEWDAAKEKHKPKTAGVLSLGKIDVCLMFNCFMVNMYDSLILLLTFHLPHPPLPTPFKYSNLSEGGMKALLRPFTILSDSRWHKFLTWFRIKTDFETTTQISQRICTVWTAPFIGCFDRNLSIYLSIYLIKYV